jgi:hypothetical protein
MMHGHGTFISNTCEKYVGTFVRGEMEGIGTMEWPSRGDKYEGHWSSGVMNGEGSFFSGVDGSLFKGNFKDGEKIGHGVIELSSGDTYSGLFDGDDTDTVFGIIKTAEGIIKTFFSVFSFFSFFFLIFLNFSFFFPFFLLIFFKGDSFQVRPRSFKYSYEA